MVFDSFYQLVQCKVHEKTPILTLKTGQLRGTVEDVDSGNNKIYLYQGIRYGQAKRFEIAKPVESWDGVYNATIFRDGCPQFGNFNSRLDNPLVQSTTFFSEDCLYLNVFKPVSTTLTPKAVMVWIHGGAFEVGTIFTSMFDGKYIAHGGDVIVVSINYRLGPLGFLYGGSVPGNLGLHDQILALKWVQQNIPSFGGDPNRVTIFGESAGSVSVALLLLSPLTNGLFQRAIMQSGGPAQFITNSKSTALEKTIILARKLNCPVNDNINATIECLRNSSVAQMQNATNNDFATNEFFVPVYGDQLVPLQPVEALRSGKLNRQIDLMYGVNRDEGTLLAPMLVPELAITENSSLTIASTKQQIIKIVKFYGLPAAEEVANFYTGKLHNPTQDDLKIAVSSVWGDAQLVCPTILFGEQFASLAPSTNHFYSYRLMQPLTLPGLPFPKWTGITHGQDLFYLFMVPIAKLDPSLHQLSRDMIGAWTNFAKTGNPEMVGSIVWENALNRNVTKDHQYTSYLHLEATKYKMVGNFYKEVCNTFWRPKIWN